MSNISNISASSYQYRYLARFIIEAETPLAVGSGDNDLMTDSPVALDVNDLPYIPATTLAGVIRHSLRDKGMHVDNEWGMEANNESDNSHGSNFILTEAKMLDSEGKVVDGVRPDTFADSLLKHYSALPVRHHARINFRGTVAEAGKYDGQIVFAGTRFCFEMEWMATTRNDALWNQTLAEFLSPTFRIGGGTRCGYGELKVVDHILTACLDLRNADHLQLYLSKSSHLGESSHWPGWKEMNCSVTADTSHWTEYTLRLRPVDLFLFSSATGDKEGTADMTAVKEPKVTWNKNKAIWKAQTILIPASSIKGALSHRVAYHYNRLTGCTVEQLYQNYSGENLVTCFMKHTGGGNKAVTALFGSEGEYKDGIQTAQRGNVILSDLFLDEETFHDKLVNHVTIDDFTGAAIEGHLFTEKPVYGRGREFVMKIIVLKSVLEEANIRSAFECALADICQGYLPLGGGVNRGNGLFEGTYTK